MKHIITLLVLNIVFLLLLSPQLVLAQNMTSGETVTLEENQTIQEDYFASGETVTILGTVESDAYLAGETVIVSGIIDGDLLVAGGTVNINGTINGNIRAMGGTVSISGNVGKNITVLAGQTLVTQTAHINGSLVAGTGKLDVLAPLGGGMTFAAGTATIGSSVNGNILAGAEQIILTDNASVNGNLTYYSNENAKLTESDHASISGTVTERLTQHKPQGVTNTKEFVAGIGLFLKFLSLLSAFLIGMICIYLAPNALVHTTQNLSKNLPLSFIVGIAFYMLLPIVFIALLISLIGIPLLLLFIPLTLFLAFFSKIFVALLIGQFILVYVKQKTSLGWTFFIGIVIYGFLTVIPVIGWIISLFSMIAGTGAILLYKKQIYSSLRQKKVV